MPDEPSSPTYPGGSSPYGPPPGDGSGGPGGPGPGGGYPADPAPTGGDPLPDSPLKRYMRRYVREVIDSENAARGDYFFAENFHNHDPAPGEQPGREGAKSFIASIFAAFSGFRTNVAEQVGEDDLIAGRWSQTFAQTGSYLGFPATGKSVLIGGITITRVRDGEIVEEWEARDAASLLQQLGFAPPVALEGGTMSDEHEDQVRRFFYDAWNAGNAEFVDELFADDFVNHVRLPGQDPGRAGIKQHIRRFHAAFPDGAVSVDLIFGERDRVVTRWTACGTHAGSYLSVPASDVFAHWTGITIHRLEEGRIVEEWTYVNLAELLQQLGAVELPGEGEYAPPGPRPGETPSPPAPSRPRGRKPTEAELKAVARRWFEAINTGDVDALDHCVDYHVTDHSGLSGSHGYGCDGHKSLVRELRRIFPDWESTIEELTVRGDDLVTIRHTGRGTCPPLFGDLVGEEWNEQPMEFELVSTVRVRDGKIVEHWANKGPFGRQGGPGWPSGEASPAVYA